MSVLGLFKSMVKTSLTRLGVNASDVTLDSLQLAEKTSVASKAAQLSLSHIWRSAVRQGGPLPTFRDVEFRAFSQNGEDGIILYIFSVIGWHTKTCVEICAGDGIQCNTANLILNHGFSGLLVDGNETLIRRGKEFYARHPDARVFPPKWAHTWIDRETVNAVITSHGFKGDVDLLSLDLDGVDYWIWDVIDAVSPRVVVAEIQCIWGHSVSVTVPYRRDFSSPAVEGKCLYSGASLPAFVKLAKRKGYRLVGAQELGFNAFFVRNDVGLDALPEVSVESCLDRPFVNWASRRFMPLVKDQEWIEV
jgi:hypothetical protein